MKPTQALQLLILVVANIVGTPVALAQTHFATSADARQFMALMHKEDTLNVGKILPAGTLVTTPAGAHVDLHALLHGPVTLLKVSPECAPCSALMGYVQDQGASYKSQQNATLVVLFIGYAGQKLPALPAGVTVLTTKDKLKNGFLAGRITPAVFFFDNTEKLLARRSGLTSPADFLNRRHL